MRHKEVKVWHMQETGLTPQLSFHKRTVVHQKLKSCAEGLLPNLRVTNVKPVKGSAISREHAQRRGSRTNAGSSRPCRASRALREQWRPGEASRPLQAVGAAEVGRGGPWGVGEGCCRKQDVHAACWGHEGKVPAALISVNTRMECGTLETILSPWPAPL